MLLSGLITAFLINCVSVMYVNIQTSKVVFGMFSMLWIGYSIKETRPRERKINTYFYM